MSEPPACLVCGTCCFSRLSRYVRVTGEDHKRLGARADELSVFDGYQAFMRMHDGHCAALEISARTGEFICGAYDIRPEVCRALIRGSDVCSAEIAEKSERPLVALRLARAT